MKVHFRLLLETLFLTALIWTYADQASFETYSAMLAVRIDTPSPDLVGRIAIPTDGAARVEGARGGTAEVIHIPMKLRGTRAAIRRLELEKGSGPTPFELKVPISDDAETQVSRMRDIRDDVARLPALRDRGLQLEELSRQTILFTLDRYVPVKISLDTDAGKFSEALDGKPQIEPNTVTAKVLESELRKRDMPEPRLILPIEEQIRPRAEDVAASFEVALPTKWEGMDAKFEPQQVRVNVLLAKAYERVNIAVIPLQVLNPPGITLGDYQIEWQTRADLLQDIDVRMPIGKPRALTNTDVTAFIRLEKSDLPDEASLAATTTPAGTEGWIQREIRFVFPPEFGDVQVDGPPRQVKFRINKKAAGTDLPPLSDVFW